MLRKIALALALSLWGGALFAQVTYPPSAGGFPGGTITAPILGSSGSVSAPTYSFSANTDVGFYYTTTPSNGMALSVDGVAVALWRDNASWLLKSNGTLNWSNGDVIAGTPDTGLARFSAGRILVTDGSSGTGTLMLGPGSASAPALAHKFNNNATGIYFSSDAMHFANNTVDSAFIDSGGFGVLSGSQYRFSSSASAPTSVDTGLARAAAGVVRITDGGSGVGTLALDTAATSASITGGTNRIDFTTGSAVQLRLNNNLRAKSTVQYAWSSGDPTAVAEDTGLARAAAGVVRTTDGGAGYSRLILADGTVASPSISWASSNGTNAAGITYAGSRVVVVVSNQYQADFDSGVKVPSTGGFLWGSSTSENNSPDTGFGRVAAGVAKVTDGSSGLGWIQTKGQSFLASNYTNATASFTSTALSVTVTSGRKYAFQAVLFVNDSTAAEGCQFDFNGGTAGATNFIASSIYNDNAGTISTQSRTTTLAGTFSIATCNATAATVTIQGSFEPSSNGTFIIRGAQVSHTSGTLTISRGSWLRLEDMP